MSQDRFDTNFDHSDITKPVQPRRVEVITAVERRRRWPLEVKQRIVAECLAPGAVASHVAHRHGISPQQLFGWRTQLRDEMAAAASRSSPACAPVLVDAAAQAGAAVVGTTNGRQAQSALEIVVGKVMVRVYGTVDGQALADVLKAVRHLA